MILIGLPGSGKTAVASWLADQTDSIIISRDTIKRALFGRHDVGVSQNALAFEVMKMAIPVSTTLAQLVILDGMPFSRVGQVEAVRDIAATNGIESIPVFLDCSIESAQDRLQIVDPEGPYDRDADLVSRVADEFREIPSSWLRVNADNSLNHVRDEVWTSLESQGAVS